MERIGKDRKDERILLIARREKIVTILSNNLLERRRILIAETLRIFLQKIGTSMVLLLWLCGVTGANAAQKSPPGREIFTRQCSKCHGRNGEGVKGKYEGPIH